MAAPLLWVPLVGLGPSTFPLGLTLINLRTRTPAGSAPLSGFMQGVGYAVACLGPLLFGELREATGGWTWPRSEEHTSELQSLMRRAYAGSRLKTKKLESRVLIG